jgi:hypothetical protein
MGVKISREMPLGSGSKGFRFKNYPDTTADKEQYDQGRVFEKARLREGSFARKIYDRLSSYRTPAIDSIKQK